MAAILSFIRLIFTFIFLIINLVKDIVLIIFEAATGVFNVATGFCAEIAVPLYIIVAVSIIYKIVSVGKSGE